METNKEAELMIGTIWGQVLGILILAEELRRFFRILNSLTWWVSVWWSVECGAFLPLGEHLAMSGDTLDCHALVGER